MPIRECPKCKNQYAGSFVVAMHYQATKTREGYLGGYCKCGEKLGDSFDYHGILDDKRRVYWKDDHNWRMSLSQKEHKRVFGGPKNAQIQNFNYSEIFLAKNANAARRKFMRLVKALQKNIVGRARLIRANLTMRAIGLYHAYYRLQTADLPSDVSAYLRLKRKKLGVLEDAGDYL